MFHNPKALREAVSPILLLDGAGVIIASSRGAADLLEVPNLKARRGIPLADLIRDDPTRLHAVVSQAKATGLPVGVSLTFAARVFDGTLVRIAAQPSGTDTYQLQFDRPVQEQTLMLQERFRLAKSAAQIGFWEHDLERSLVTWDPVVCAHYGIAPDSFDGTAEMWASFVHPDDRAGAQARFAESIRTGRDLEDEFRIIHADGGIRTLREWSCAVRDEQGKVVRILGINCDITAQRDAETAARNAGVAMEQANRRFQLLADKAPGAMFECRQEPDGRISYPYFSARFPKMLGLDAQTILEDADAPMAALMPTDMATFTDGIRHAAKTGKMFSGRFRITDADRGERWIMASLEPLSEANGAVSWYGNLFDVSDYEEAEGRAAAALADLVQANSMLQRMADNAPGALFMFRNDQDGVGTFEFFSTQFADIHACTRAEVERYGMEATSRVIHPDDVARVFMALENARTTMSPMPIKYRIIHPQRGELWVMSTAQPIRSADGTVIWYGNLIDITDLQDAERRAAAAVADLKHAHDRLQRIANIAPVALYEMHRSRTGEISFPYFSDRFLELTGMTKANLMRGDVDVFQNVLTADVARFQTALQASVKTLKPFKLRFRVDREMDEPTWLQVVSDVRKEPDGAIVWTCVAMDVSTDVARENALNMARTDAIRIQTESEWQALHDGLTGLPNRRYYDKTFSQRLTNAVEGDEADAILVRIDLDHFKHVNDTLGHGAGDLVLTRVATVLRDTFRQEDFSARIGGDEFSVLMATGTSPDQALDVISKVRTALAEPVIYEGRTCRFGCSFGVAHVENLGVVGDELHSFSDAALYRAKALGRNRVEVFTPALHREILDNRRLASDIHVALEDAQFEPYFQPQVCAKTGAILGAEVLLRWNHPTDGVVAPGVFMGVAEQLMVMGDIDRQMMERTHQVLKRLKARGQPMPKVSFNVSSSRMHDPSVVQMASEISKTTSVAFELLESILIEEESAVFGQHLTQLRDIGVEVEIDDFGSGHASILSVIKCEPDALKIDQRLVQPVEYDARTRKLVRAIIEIAETLEIKTIAEGIETEAQHAILCDLGCDVMQGYLFSRPVPEEALFAFMTSYTAKPCC